MKHGYYNSELEQRLLEILANTLCTGEVQQFQEVLSENCIYRSDCSGESRLGVHNIIDFITDVASSLSEATAYRYELVSANEEILESAKDDLPGAFSGDWCLRLWQGADCNPVAISFIQYNENSQITNILLSTNKNYLKSFAGSPAKSVIEISYPQVDTLLCETFGEEATVAEMRKNGFSAPDEKDVYVWQKADSFITDWLSNNSYRLTGTELFDDCIGYACIRQGIKYAVYMYAYGEKKTTMLDGDYCAKLRDYALSQDRTILVIYLHVTPELQEDGTTLFYVGQYGSKDKYPEVWQLGWIEDKSAMLFVPRKEIEDLGRRLIAAYNSQRLDVLRSIFAEGASLEHPNGSHSMNDAVYSSLAHYYKKHGPMKTAYVRYNDVVYSEVGYIDNLCFVHFTFNQDNKITCLKFAPLDESYRELYVTAHMPTSHLLDNVPSLENVEFLSPSELSRFSMLLQFSNGETKRYDAPGDFGDDAAAMWLQTTFTDKIFQNGRIADPVSADDRMFYRSYPQTHQGVEFINGASISTVELYHASYPVGKFCYKDGIEVFEHTANGDDGFTVGNIRNLDPTDPLYLLDTNAKIATVIPAPYQNTPIIIYPFCGGYSEGLVMVSTMGEIDLQYHHNRHGCAGMWGWLDTDMNVVIEPKYVYAMNFVNGRAIVCKGVWDISEKKGKPQYWCENEQWGVIDKNEQEVVPCKYDELYEIDGTDRLYFVHEGGWKNGHFAIYDVKERQIILELEFHFDMGYMFNECFVADGDVLIFMDHLPGKGEDLIYAYDLHQKKFLAYAESYTERAYNGQSKVVINKDGQDIIVF